MFAKELRQAGHVRKLSIKKAAEPGCWEIRDVQDDHVLKDAKYTDWHRVERALNLFTILADDLESRGWVSPTR